jgi:hypothetical protein
VTVQEQLDELRAEAHKLFVVFVETLGIDRLVGWLAKKLDRQS